MWQTFQKLLRKLVPLQKLFAFFGATGMLFVAYILFGRQPEYDRYLLPLVMFIAWNLSLASVTWGIQYTDIQAPEYGIFNKLTFKLSKAILLLSEFLFFLTSIALVWLSIRVLNFY